MLLRAVPSEDRSEHQYWHMVHSDTPNAPLTPPSSRHASRKRHVLTISDIDRQHHLHDLLQPATYQPSSPLYQQLCSLVIRRGSEWSLAVPSTFLSTPAGTALLMASTAHAAAKRMHCRQDQTRRRVTPSFDQLMPAYFWSPLVHRLRDKAAWSRFYRQQHRLNGRALIASGLARSVASGTDRYDHDSMAFLSDAELSGMVERVNRAATKEERMQILNIHPGDRFMFD